MSIKYQIDRQLPQRSKLKFMFINTQEDESGIKYAKDVYVTQLPFYENISISESRKSNWVPFASIQDTDSKEEYAGAEHRTFRLEFDINLQHLLQEQSTGEENVKNKIFTTIFSKETINQESFERTPLLPNLIESTIPYSKELQNKYILNSNQDYEDTINSQVNRKTKVIKNILGLYLKPQYFKPRSKIDSGKHFITDVTGKAYSIKQTPTPTPPLPETPKAEEPSFFEQVKQKLSNIGDGFINLGKSVGGIFTDLGGIIIKGRPDQSSKILAIIQASASPLIKSKLAELFENTNAMESNWPIFSPSVSTKRAPTLNDYTELLETNLLTHRNLDNYVYPLEEILSPAADSNGEVIKVLDKIVFLINLLRVSVSKTSPSGELEAVGTAPLVILNHGILYQNVPCFVNSYQFVINKNSSYDVDTLLPFTITITLDMFESKKTAEESFFSKMSGENTERRDIKNIGWESVINKPYSFDLTKDEVIF